MADRESYDGRERRVRGTNLAENAYGRASRLPALRDPSPNWPTSRRTSGSHAAPARICAPITIRTSSPGPEITRLGMSHSKEKDRGPSDPKVTAGELGPPRAIDPIATPSPELGDGSSTR